MKIKLTILAGLLITIALLSVNLVYASPNVQTHDSLDDSEFIWKTDLYNNGSLSSSTYTGIQLGSGFTWTVIEDENGFVMESRAATPDEVSTYDFEKNLSDKSHWVTNRLADLQSCYDNMTTAQGFDFNSLGVNTQNDLMREVEFCTAVNSLVLKKALPFLQDLYKESVTIETP